MTWKWLFTPQVCGVLLVASWYEPLVTSSFPTTYFPWLRLKDQKLSEQHFTPLVPSLRLWVPVPGLIDSGTRHKHISLYIHCFELIDTVLCFGGRIKRISILRESVSRRQCNTRKGAGHGTHTWKDWRTRKLLIFLYLPAVDDQKWSHNYFVWHNTSERHSLANLSMTRILSWQMCPVDSVSSYNTYLLRPPFAVEPGLLECCSTAATHVLSHESKTYETV